MTQQVKIDRIDRKIISLIQHNPQITHTDIASKVDRSQPTVGMRIRRLQDMGVLQYQAGLNLKEAKEFYLARVDLITNKPEEVLRIVEGCPFMLNAFRLSGDFNISILMASNRLQNIDKIVNFHFREDSIAQEVVYNIISDVSDDFVLPINFEDKNCDCALKDECFINDFSKEVPKN